MQCAVPNDVLDLEYVNVAQTNQEFRVPHIAQVGGIGISS